MPEVQPWRFAWLRPLTEMQWVFVTLLLALQPGAAALIAKCDNVAQLSGLKGEIYAVGGADASEPCGWHIYPNRRLERMEFNVTESRLQGGDQLAFYSYKLQHPSTTVGTFSVSNQVPSQLELRGAAAWPKVPGSQQCSGGSGRPSGRERRILGAWLPKHAATPCRLRNVADSHPGSNEVLIVFSAIQEGSVFRMTYEAFATDEIRFFGIYLSPISFVMCVVLVSALSPPRDPIPGPDPRANLGSDPAPAWTLPSAPALTLALALSRAVTLLLTPDP